MIARREARRVPADWQHPKDSAGDYIPLLSGAEYKKWADQWDEENEQWSRGMYRTADKEWATIASSPTVSACAGMTYAEWAGDRPIYDMFMPVWRDDECTHWMMYDTTTLGTPISPAFATAEQLAHWLEDNRVSFFGNRPADFDDWMEQIVDWPEVM